MSATLTAPKATAAEIEFVSSLSSPNEILEAISKGIDAVRAAGNNVAAIEKAVDGTWLEIAELEGEDAATTITDNLWPREW